MPDSVAKYGFFSAKALDDNGSCWYLTPDGSEVEVTAVYDDAEGKDYDWLDKVCVGPVIKWIRNGKQKSKFRRLIDDE